MSEFNSIYYLATCPCQNCPKRHAGCHDECDEYKAYTAELQREKKLRQRQEMLYTIGIIKKQRRR